MSSKHITVTYQGIKAQFSIFPFLPSIDLGAGFGLSLSVLEKIKVKSLKNSNKELAIAVDSLGYVELAENILQQIEQNEQFELVAEDLREGQVAKLTPRELKKLNQEFDTIDQNKDNIATPEEVENYFKAKAIADADLMKDIMESQDYESYKKSLLDEVPMRAQLLLMDADANSDGVLSREEYIANQAPFVLQTRRPFIVIKYGKQQQDMDTQDSLSLEEGRLLFSLNVGSPSTRHYFELVGLKHISDGKVYKAILTATNVRTVDPSVLQQVKGEGEEFELLVKDNRAEWIAALSEQEVKQLKQKFEAMDKDNSGAISKDEVEAFEKQNAAKLIEQEEQITQKLIERLPAKKAELESMFASRKENILRSTDFLVKNALHEDENNDGQIEWDEFLVRNAWYASIAKKNAASLNA